MHAAMLLEGAIELLEQRTERTPPVERLRTKVARLRRAF